MCQLAFLSNVPLRKHAACIVPSELMGILHASISDIKFLAGHFFLSNDPRGSSLLARGPTSACIAAPQRRSWSGFGPFAEEAEGGGAPCRAASVPGAFSSTCLASQGIQP